MIKCSCHSCGCEVPAGVENHFTADDGRILCGKCSVGVKPCSDRIKQILISKEREC